MHKVTVLLPSKWHLRLSRKAACFCLSLLLPIAATAETIPADNVWQPEAKIVCDQVQLAASHYQKGDVKSAKLNAVMSYFKGYDANIEPAVRVTLGGAHVFGIERQFRDYSAAMTPNPDKNQLKKVSALAAQLCKSVKEDADALNAAHVKRNVFNVE